jgi:soluble lytic murein transglycosylase
MMQRCSGRIIQDHLHRTRATATVFIAIAAICAAVTSRAAGDPLADLKAGVAALDAKKYAAAISLLEPLIKRLPKIADYTAFFLASARFGAADYAGVPKTLDPVFKMTPASPLAPRAVLLVASAYFQSGDMKQAIDTLRKNYATLPQPAGDLAMALAFAASGDGISAVVYHQRVYYGYPTSAEAAQSGQELATLRAGLGDKFPPAMPNAMLGRAVKLMDAKQYAKARGELEELVPQLGGAEKDLARVRISVADYNTKDTVRAHSALASLEVPTPEADAERFHYLLLCAQRLKNQDEVNSTLEKLARLYPNSKWRLESLIAAASHSLIENQMQAYEPIYRACYESFPKEPRAAECHWKVTWGHYIRRQEDAAEMLRAHLRMFPGSEYAAGALYFLGRLAENARDLTAARAYYDEILREYPNYYYNIVARERLKEIGAGPPSPKVTEFLRGIGFPERSRTLDFRANPTAQLRIERARLLASAGLDDWAVNELRYGAQNEDQPHVLAVELAAMTTKTVGPDQAMRYIKRYAGTYLFMPIESAPAEFWKLAFPLPYRADLERFAKQNGLDPFLVAALIRQESEFNPKAVSPRNARGLTQILPGTGRELSRKLKVKSYATASLFQPAVNLQLGTFYLKTIVDNLGGRWEAALAAYNAGPSRAKAWSSWGEFREPAEFIETVPFAETRNYIQTVLRNADTYRRIYSGEMRAGLK